MSRPSAEFEFQADDTSMVLEHMGRLGAEHRGWVNVQPGFRDEDAPSSTSGLGILFSGSVHDVPVCTWVAGHVGRHGLEPDTVGVQHAAGMRMMAELRSRGIAVPDSWRLAQDHPRRGIVMRTPVGTSHAEQLTWLLAVGPELSTVPLTGDWMALVYEGR